jgi:hypothetical protein
MHVQTNRRDGGGRIGSAAVALRDPGNAACAALAAAWMAGLAFILAHRIYVTNDSLSNYIHVWYVADRFWGGHGVPLRMPVLGHGDAFAFPYGFIPWFTAALARPLLGDWAVTLSLVIGALGVIAAQWWAFPELRGGWWTAMMLANPMLVEAPLLGQLPFLWATAMTFAAIALWRADRRLLAAIVFGAAQATHPAVALPLAGCLVAGRLYREPRRLRLLALYALSLAIAAPATYLVLASPSVGDASTATLLGTFFGTLSLRALVVGAPFILLLARRTPLARVKMPALVIIASLNLVLVPVRQNEFGWTALVRTPDASLSAFIDSPAFDPDGEYRLLRVGDGKVGMYDLVRAGARLDSEPFPEGIDRRSFASAAEYARFLERRTVDYVIVYDNYDGRYRTNEHHLLSEMAQAATAPCAQLVTRSDGFDVYRILGYENC